MTAFEDLIADALEHFLVIALVDEQNNVVAESARAGLDAESASAPVETARRIFNNPESRRALQNLQESLFYDLDGRRLVCRPVQFRGQPHLLIILAAAERAYRRALNTLVRRLPTVE
ncbi:MAG: hypothetical protein GYB66_07950 [Chloroflexi bacterium]|nr:hypothetical protein [Chloroflexota bacterium]